jgi:hypothetical protein
MVGVSGRPPRYGKRSSHEKGVKVVPGSESTEIYSRFPHGQTMLAAANLDLDVPARACLGSFSNQTFAALLLPQT